MAWVLATQRNNRPIWLILDCAVSMEPVQGREYAYTRVKFNHAKGDSTAVEEVLEIPEDLLADVKGRTA